MGLLIFLYEIRHDKSFVWLISIPLELKSQGTQQRARELIRLPDYWLCRGSSLNQWHEHPLKSTDMVCLTQVVRKCPKRAGVVLAPPSGQIREKKLFFEPGCVGVLSRPRSHLGAPNTSSSPTFLLTGISGSFHTPCQQIKLFCHTAQGLRG